jgi:predicted permease
VTNDLGYAIRGLRRSPGLTATIVLTLALGVGVNAAMFTAVDRVFFQSPPGVSHPEQVRRLVAFSRSIGNAVIPNDRFTVNDPVAYRTAIGSVAEFEGYDVESEKRVDGGPDQHTVAYATTGFFHLAGVHPFRGRFFTADENVYGSPHNVAILNYHFWKDRFGGDEAVLGRTMRVDSTLFTIVGIMQPRFDGMDVDAVDVWAPLASLPSDGAEGPWWQGGFQILRVFMRLSSGANLHTVEGRLNATFRAGAQSWPSFDAATRLETSPLIQGRSAIKLGYQDDRNLDLMVRLAGVALVVLIIATTNVASLLLMRALRRRREIAIRIALGVSRPRLVAQLIVESTLLAFVGGVAALGVAWATGDVIRSILIQDVHWSATLIDDRVVAVTIGLAIIAGLAAGLAPATMAFRDDVTVALKTGSTEAGRPRSSLRVSLLVTQTALCMLLLAAAGVFLESLQRAGNLDLGFDADRLISFNMYGTDPGVRDAAVAKIRALPGVTSVSRTETGLLGGGIAQLLFTNGDSMPSRLGPWIGSIDTAYAGTIGLRLLRGRLLSPDDDRTHAAVVVINEAMAKEYWRDRDPIGQCFYEYKRTDPCERIVGIVSTVRMQLTGQPHKMFYRLVPPNQAAFRSMISVRTSGRATAAMAGEISRLVSELPGRDPQNLATPRLATDRLEPEFRPWRIAAAMFLLFGLLALMATGTGIYGLIAYDVTQRTHEFGVRMTLGATTSAILGLVLESGLRVIAVGIVVGVAASLAAGRLIASMLFETRAYDPVALIATSLTVALVALAASFIPAWRATRVDPVVALRAD